MDRVIYHKNCADGFCAAFLLHLAFPEITEDRFYSAQYGDSLPDCSEWRGDRVFIVDFSYPPSVIRTLSDAVGPSGRVIMLDHHKTAAASFVSMPANVSLTFDMSRCGSWLVRDWLIRSFDGTDRHLDCVQLVNDWGWLVNYVEDRDLWQWRLRWSREVSAAIASYPRTFLDWSSFTLEKLRSEGTAILRYQNQMLESLVTKAIVGADGVLRCNSPVLQSELGELLGAGEGVKYADIWYKDADGSVIHSLRSAANGADVSIVAAQYGGGGHAHAAGYKEVTVR